MAAVGLDLSQPEKKLLALARSLRSEEDGKEIRKDLVKKLRAAAGPARQAARDSIRGAASSGHKGKSLRSGIAAKIQVVAKPTGYAVGVRVVAKQTPNLRGFTNAPRRFNSASGWEHPVFGTRKSVHQVGRPGWFDESIQHRKPEFRRAVEDVMKETARRVARSI